MRVIDAHAHVASDRFVRRSFVEGIADNEAARLGGTLDSRARNRIVDMILAQLQDHDASGFVRAMDDAGVAGAMLLNPDFTYGEASDLSDYAEQLELHDKIVECHQGRLAYFGGPDPRWGRVGVDLFERSVKVGRCAGLKIYPPCGYCPSDEALYPFYEICEANSLPVLLHTGPTSASLEFRFADPARIDGAARAFSKVNFILAHAGVFNVDAAVQQVAFRPNVYLDMSGYAGETSANCAGHALRTSGALENFSHKILFGTDWPIFAQAGSYRSIVGQATGAETFTQLVDRKRSLIFAGNLQRLVGEDLFRVEDVAVARKAKPS